jgi:hypothetical protein
MKLNQQCLIETAKGIGAVLTSVLVLMPSAAFAQGIGITGGSDGWKTFLAKVAREGSGQMVVTGPIAAKFASTFGSQAPVMATAKVVRELSIAGCKRLLINITMPGVTVKDSTGRDHPIDVRSNMNMCIDGSIPGQEQLKPEERTK